MAGGVTSGLGPEFKLWYRKKEKQEQQQKTQTNVGKDVGKKNSHTLLVKM
jgi:hypothetical protein